MKRKVKSDAEIAYQMMKKAQRKKRKTDRRHPEDQGGMYNLYLERASWGN